MQDAERTSKLRALVRYLTHKTRNNLSLPDEADCLAAHIYARIVRALHWSSGIDDDKLVLVIAIADSDSDEDASELDAWTRRAFFVLRVHSAFAATPRAPPPPAESSRPPPQACG